MKKLLVITFTVLLLGACSNDLYKYYDYDNLVYAYSTRDIQEKEMKKFVKRYSRIVDLPKGKRRLPPPGACSEYAFLLFKQGKVDQAREYFAKEVVIYPESQTYVNTLMKSLGL